MDDYSQLLKKVGTFGGIAAKSVGIADEMGEAQWQILKAIFKKVYGWDYVPTMFRLRRNQQTATRYYIPRQPRIFNQWILEYDIDT